METGALAAGVGGGLTTLDASLALMFSEVTAAVERLSLCLCLQRRIGASHALLHLRRLAALVQRHCGSEAKPEAREIARALARPLKELDDALAADHLAPGTISDALLRLSFVTFRFWQLAKLFGMPEPEVSARPLAARKR